MTTQSIFLIVVIAGLAVIFAGHVVNAKSKKAKRVLGYVGIALFAVGMIGNIVSIATAQEKPATNHGLVRHDPANFRQD